MLWMRRSTYRRPIWSMTKTTTAMSAMTSRVSPVPERRASGSQEMESARNSMLTGYQVLSGMVDEAKVTKMIPGPGRRAWRSRFTPIIHGALNNGQGLHVCAPAARLCGIWQACRIRAFGRVDHTHHPFYRPKYQHPSPPRTGRGSRGGAIDDPACADDNQARHPVNPVKIDTMVRGVRSRTLRNTVHEVHKIHPTASAPGGTTRLGTTQLGSCGRRKTGRRSPRKMARRRSSSTTTIPAYTAMFWPSPASCTK